MPLHDVENEFRLAWAVRRAWVNHHLRGEALTLESIVIFVPLGDGNPLIRFAVQDQSGRCHALDMSDGRVFLETVEGVPSLAAKVVGQESGDVGRARKTPQVRHSSADRGRLESVRLRDGPTSHEPAVTPAHDGETVR